MSNLIAKIMSRESLADSDARKTFKLIIIPEDNDVGFQRDEVSKAVKMVITALYGEPSGSVIPLVDCGKVYMLHNGKTVSTFDPDEPITTPREIKGEFELTVNGDSISIKAPVVTMQGSHDRHHQVLLENMHSLAPPAMYPGAARWNAQIAAAIVTGHATATLTMVQGNDTAVDHTAVSRYFNRVIDVALNYKAPVQVKYEQNEDGSYYAWFEPAKQTRNINKFPINKQALVDAGFQGLVLNYVERALKILSLGGNTVFTNPPIKTSQEDTDAITAFFVERGFKPQYTFTNVWLQWTYFCKLND